MTVHSLWGTEHQKDKFWPYLPEKFRNRPPPAELFWRIYAHVHPNLFKKHMAAQKKRFEKENPGDVNVTVSANHMAVLNRAFATEDDITTLSFLKRTQKS